jgi:hypothetical protein
MRYAAGRNSCRINGEEMTWVKTIKNIVDTKHAFRDDGKEQVFFRDESYGKRKKEKLGKAAGRGAG